MDQVTIQAQGSRSTMGTGSLLQGMSCSPDPSLPLCKSGMSAFQESGLCPRAMATLLATAGS